MRPGGFEPPTRGLEVRRFNLRKRRFSRMFKPMSVKAEEIFLSENSHRVFPLRKRLAAQFRSMPERNAQTSATSRRGSLRWSPTTSPRGRREVRVVRAARNRGKLRPAANGRRSLPRAGAALTGPSTRCLLALLVLDITKLARKTCCAAPRGLQGRESARRGP